MGDKYRPRRERTPPPVPTDEQKQAAAKAEYEKLLSARSGGVYIPPARLRALQSQITDKKSKEYQRMAWEALKKSINGLVNKANVANMKHIVPELFAENLVRGRGLLAQSLIKAQAASLPFTPIYAALIAIVNTKIPLCGDLLCRRLVLRFRKAFRRSDKAVCLSSTTFLAHLVNQQVAHELVIAQILLLLLKNPTDDSVEIAVNITREVGQFLEEMNPPIAMVIFDRFRNILNEADIEKRTQYAIEVLFQIRKDKFKDNPAVREELDLVEEEDQIKHMVELDGELDDEATLNIFRFDDKYEEHEEEYAKLKAEILGEGSDYESGSGEDESSEEEDEGENEEQKALEVKDQSNADLVNLRRVIYLTIQSSMDAEEAVHKLMKVNLPAGQEAELPSMIVESCSQEKTYTKFFGLLGERFCKINRLWQDLFEQAFVKYYETIHRYETNRLRNIARFFGHLLASDALGWHVLSAIHLNEEETTSASRIFIKILFQDMAESMGMPKLQARLKEETLQPSLAGLFPRDNARDVRFSINYFTSIGMGALTEDTREWLQNMPKPALPAPAAAASESDSESVSSYSSYTGSSYSSRSRSRSRTPPRKAIDRDRSRDGRGRSVSRTPPRRAARGRSYSTSRSRSRSSRRSSTSRSRSRSPPPRREAARRGSISPRAPPRGRRASSSSSRGRGRGGGRGRGRGRSSSSSSTSRSRSRSRSPPPRGREPATKPAPRRGASYSRSPSPPPRRQPSPRPQRDQKRKRRDDSTSSSSPDSHRRRRSSPSPQRDGGKGKDRAPARGRRRGHSTSSSSTSSSSRSRSSSSNGTSRSRRRSRPNRGGAAAVAAAGPSKTQPRDRDRDVERERERERTASPPSGRRRRRNSSSSAGSSGPRKRYRRGS